MKLEDHVRNAVRQMRSGETIGRRGTPVISFWPMRPKWEKWGNAWETLGTDGDTIVEPTRVILPAVIQLAYFRFRDSVCQLAYIIQEESADKRPEEIFLYEKARFNMPKEVE